MCFAELQPTLALAETRVLGVWCFAEFGTHPATFPCGRDLPGRAEVVSGLWDRGLLGPGTPGRCDQGVDGWQQGAQQRSFGVVPALLCCVTPKPAASLAGVCKLPQWGQGLLEKGRCRGEGDKT